MISIFLKYNDPKPLKKLRYLGTLFTVVVDLLWTSLLKPKMLLIAESIPTIAQIEKIESRVNGQAKLTTSDYMYVVVINDNIIHPNK